MKKYNITDLVLFDSLRNQKIYSFCKEHGLNNEFKSFLIETRIEKLNRILNKI